MNTKDNVMDNNINNAGSEMDSSSSILKSFFHKYLPYWPLFSVIFLVFIALAYFYNIYSSKIYETSAKILVKESSQSAQTSTLLESLDLFDGVKHVENEIEIIKSIELTSQVVKNLRLYAMIIEENNLQNKSAFISSPVMIEFLNPDSIKKASHIYFEYLESEESIVIGAKKIKLYQWVDIGYGKMRFYANPNYRFEKRESTKNLYFNLFHVYEVADDLVNRIDVQSAGKQASVIYLKLQDEVPARSEAILNELIDVYNKAAVQDKNILAANTLQFVNDRLFYVANELDSVEFEMQKYKIRNNIVDISEQGKMFLSSAGRTDELLSSQSVQLSVLEEVQKNVLNGSSSLGIMPSTLGVVDPILSELLNRLFSAEIRYQGLKGTTALNNPIMIALKEEIDVLKPKVIANIESQKRSLLSGESTINQDKYRYSSILELIPKKERELLQISRQQSIKNSIYTYLLQKREETALSLAATVADSRLIDRAHTSLAPISPKKKMTFILFGGISIIISFIVVAIKEGFDYSIRDRHEIESLTDLPIVGEIVFDNSKEQIVISDGRRDIISEQFRQLRTSLSYLGIGNKTKRILITSSVSTEGKSFISANLAVAISMTDKKVVVIELDLRRPKVAKTFDIKSDIGITNFLISDISPNSIIFDSIKYPNLSIIPCGPIPPNPSELLTNGRLDILLNYLQERFDIIIIDTAPVSPVTDAFLVSTKVDSTLFVIRQGVTPKNALKNINSSINSGRIKNIGLVFNGIKPKYFGSYQYEYSYTSGYLDKNRVKV